MKKRLLLIPVLVALFLIMCVSCKSTPETPDASVSPSVSVAADVSDRAREARQRAIDVEAPAYFPTEWEFVEARYAAGMLLVNTGTEPQKAAETLEAVAKEYDELFKKAVSLYAQAKEDEIIAIRDEIKASGFADAFPDYLRAVDEIALSAKASYEAGDIAQAKIGAEKALEEYSTLLVGARTYQARREVIDRGFGQYDADNFERADEAGALAKAKYDEGDKAGAIESAEEALLRYNLVLMNGWTFYAVDRRVTATSEKEAALDDKANIASRNLFREAESLFEQAEEAFARENFQAASILFIDAEARFAISREDTAEKRANAEEAIRLASERIEASSEAAAEAERIIEGGVR